MNRLLQVILANVLLMGGSAHAIVGGKIVFTAAEEVAKSTVALYLQTDKGQAICSGTIMNNEYILTAAHCVLGVRAGSVVFSPALSTASQSSVRPIVKTNHNIDYDIKSYAEQNDVALVRFKGGIPAGYHPAYVLHPSVSLKYIQPGKPIVIAGYGITSRSAGDSGTLRKLETKIIALSPHQKQIEIGTDGRVACSGDSGGPAYIVVNGVYYVWGIASLSDCATHSIYTRMTSNFYGTPIAP